MLTPDSLSRPPSALAKQDVAPPSTVFAFECNVIGKQWQKTVNHLTASKARYTYLLDVRESWPDVTFADVTVRKLGPAHTSASFSRVAQLRGMAGLRCGQRVKHGSARGVIVGHNDNANFEVLFDADSPALAGQLVNCHPADLMIDDSAQPAAPWHLYLLECQGGALYAGITNDVSARLKKHQSGRGARFTRANPPLRLIAQASFPDRASASRAEWLLKQCPRDRKERFLQETREAMLQTDRRLLVLVHPGSACGSANYNLGKSAARAAREGIVSTLRGWRGGLIVIDGDLSDEVPDYTQLHGAIQDCLARAKAAGLPSERVMGSDGQKHNQESAIEAFIRARNWVDVGASDAPAFVVTGAWYDPAHASPTRTHGGCVGSVVERLLALGMRAEVDDSAVLVEDETEEDSDDLEVTAGSDSDRYRNTP